MLETKENIKNLNNCFRLLQSEILELKEIIKTIDRYNKLALNNSIEIINLNNQLIFNISYQFTIVLKLSCYNDLNKAFSLNTSTFKNDLIGLYDLFIDFNNNCLKMNIYNDNINIIQKTKFTKNNETVLDLDNTLNIESLELLNENKSNNIIETSNFILYTSSQQIDLLKELELIETSKLKPKKLYGQIKDTIPAHSLPVLKKEKFNFDKFKEYIVTGILETTFEDLETNKIEYFYKVERSNFYKEYDIVFKKYSYDEIREIILKEYDLFSEFYNDFINHELKYNSIESYILDNFENLKEKLLNFRNKDLFSFNLTCMIDEYKNKIMVKEIYGNLSKELFTYIIKCNDRILSLDLVNQFLKYKKQDKTIVHNSLYEHTLELFKNLYDRMNLENKAKIDNTNKLSKYLDSIDCYVNKDVYKLSYSKIKNYCENILNLKN